MSQQSATAADAATGNQQATSAAAGATPAAATTSGAGNDTTTETQQPLGLDAARELLRDADLKVERSDGRDPLFYAEGRDPLLDEQTEIDPLAVINTDAAADAAEEGEETAGKEEGKEEAEESTNEKSEEEHEEKSEEEAQEHTDDSKQEDGKEQKQQGRKRLNIYRKNGDGTFVYDARERAVLQLADEEGIGLKEAEQRLFGDTKQEAEATVEEKEQQQQQQTQANALTAAQAEITRIEGEMDAASKALDMEKYHALNKELRTAERKLGQLQSQVESVRGQEMSAYATAELESKKQSIQLFPDTGKEGTALFDAIRKDVTRLEKTNPSFFKDPEWPLTLAAKHAAVLGIAPVSAKTSSESTTQDKKTAQAAIQKKTATDAPKPKQAARLVPPGPAGGNHSVARGQETSAQEISQKIKAAQASGDIAELRRITRELSEA